MIATLHSDEQREVENEIHALVMQKNYPCVAAVQAVMQQEYIIEFYGSLGRGSRWQRMRADLLGFLENLAKGQSQFLSFFAVFEKQIRSDSEIEFERKLWNELSFLTSEEDREKDWGKNNSDPSKSSFCFCLNGEKFFVVGLHPQASRLARRFSRPLLVFNAFSQFERIKQEGGYENLVKTIRDRDVKFQSSVNPMAKAHGEAWEAIQYSGCKNLSSWQCPFQFIKKKDKPD